MSRFFSKGTISRELTQLARSLATARRRRDKDNPPAVPASGTPAPPDWPRARCDRPARLLAAPARPRTRAGETRRAQASTSASAAPTRRRRAPGHAAAAAAQRQHRRCAHDREKIEEDVRPLQPLGHRAEHLSKLSLARRRA